jgi:3-phenylpropionate/cinnamic acid dioxygenase small subunit
VSGSCHEIEKLIYTYAERIDAGDFAGVADLFARGTVRGPGGPGASGRDAVLALYTATTRRYEDDGTPHTKHVTTNVAIDVDDDAGVATARSCFTVFQGLAGFPLQPIIAGRYEDRFERFSGVWHFVERRIFPELYGDLSRHLLAALPGSGGGDER